MTTLDPSPSATGPGPGRARQRRPVPLGGAPLATPRCVEVNGQRVVVADLDGRLLAARDRCPHRGAPLSLGTVEGGCLRCSYHGWAFDASGALVEVPGLGAVRRCRRGS